MTNSLKKEQISKPQHSPTPWFLSWEDGKYGVVGSDTEGKCVCTVFNDGGEREPTRKANAKHIVHCVNNHDALVEALEAAEGHLEYCGYGDRWESSCAHNAGLPEKIKQALAKAKGESDDTRG